MYRIHNGAIVNAFLKSAGAVANRLIGQLMRVDLTGKASTTLGEGNLFFLPVATENFDYLKDDYAALQMTGVAEVYVEAFTGIAAGEPVSPGATGIGIKAAADGEFILGFALRAPVANGELIPVLISPQQPMTDSIY
jgi:hypothetical protein